MPKLKTKKGVKKRFKLTKTGKVKRAKANKSHILTKKTRGRKRALKKATTVDKTTQQSCRACPCGNDSFLNCCVSFHILHQLHPRSPVTCENEAHNQGCSGRSQQRWQKHVSGFVHKTFLCHHIQINSPTISWWL